MFTMLGVLSSPSPLSIVEAIVDDERVPDPVGVLGRLIDRSLVRRSFGADGSPRFGMLELLHERSVELLEASDEVGAVRLRHAEAVAVALEDLREHHWRHPERGHQRADRRTAPGGPRRACLRHRPGAVGARRPYRRCAHGPPSSGRRPGGGPGLARRAAATPRRVVRPHRAAVLFDQGINCWHYGELDRARNAWADAVDAYKRLGDTGWLAYAFAFLSMTHARRAR